MNDKNLTGFLNIYKEAGFTSFDVIAKLRKILNQKKIGHMGTLDPDACGVLPVALGQATKMLPYLTDHTKAYRATLLLGMVTDTYDTSGTVISKSQVNVSTEEVQEVFNRYKGKVMQVPPMFSAKKVNGKKLYELARDGKTVEREPVEIEILKNEIKEIDLPEIIFDVECSKGTYIRSICHDIGQELGCGGCMLQLLRTRSGAFDISSACKLESIKGAYEAGNISDLILPVDYGINSYKKATCISPVTKKAVNGVPLEMDEIVSEGEETDYIRVYLSDNKFLGIYEKRGKRLYPRKVFA